MADAAATLVQQPTVISTWRRTSHLGVCAVLALLIAGPLLGWSEIRRTFPSSGNGPADRDVTLLALGLRQLLQFDAWEQQSPTPRVVEQRQAFEIYIAGRLRRAMQDALHSTGQSARSLQSGPLRARAEEVFRRPVPSPEEVTRAEKVLERMLESWNRLFSMEQDARRRLSQTSLLALIAAIFGSALSPILFRGGMLLRALRFASVTQDGVEVSRSRALFRALVAWMPAYLYLEMAQRTDLLTPAQRSSYMFPVSIRVSLLPLSGTALIALAVFIVGGLFAAVRPTRGIQDWLTGTWLVPR
jgi:hypothetical protein